MIQHLLGLTTVGLKVHLNGCKDVLGIWPSLLIYLLPSLVKVFRHISMPCMIFCVVREYANLQQVG